MITGPYQTLKEQLELAREIIAETTSEKKRAIYQAEIVRLQAALAEYEQCAC